MASPTSTRRLGQARRGAPTAWAAGGFSIVELLVVVTIIVSLLAILVPSMGRVVVIMQRLACASNLHQQGIAMLGYVVDNKLFPHHVGTTYTGAWIPAWPTRVRLYAPGGNDIFYCPSQFEGWKWQEIFGGPGVATINEVNTLGYKLNERLLTLHSTPFSYGINDWGACGAFCEGGRLGLGGDPGWPSATMSMITQPSTMLAIGDNTSDGSWDYNIDPTNPREYPGKIHDEGANIVHVDGNVSWSLQKDLILIPNWPPSSWVGDNHELSKRWNTTYRRTQ